MNINHPAPGDIPALVRLWKAAFGDSDAFLDSFFATAFSQDRCLCLYTGEELASACYWLDCTCRGRRLAYLYAVATATAHRGQGLCRALLTEAKKVLASQGFSGILLVPGDAGLGALYEKLGWRSATTLREFSVAAGTPGRLLPMTPEAYAQARRKLLPEGAAIEGSALLAFLSTQARFYRWGDTVFACSQAQQHLFIPELLGDTRLAADIAATLGCIHATVRTPGPGTPWAMYCPLDSAPAPSHFSFALD